MKRIATFGGLAALLIGSSAGAVTTKVWTQDSYKSFDEGEADEALITSLGEVMPGTATERTNVESDALWSAVRGPDGTLYAGGVTDGTIYAVSGGKAKKLATLSDETPWIGALTLGPDGRLYVGTLGSATVHAVDLKTGKLTKVAKLEGADHVWALEFVGGNLYAGTGPKGQLFEVDVKGGKAKAVWDSDEAHLLSMTPASDGSLWLGTAEEAILVSLRSQDQPGPRHRRLRRRRGEGDRPGQGRLGQQHDCRRQRVRRAAQRDAVVGPGQAQGHDHQVPAQRPGLRFQGPGSGALRREEGQGRRLPRRGRRPRRAAARPQRGLLPVPRRRRRRATSSPPPAPRAASTRSAPTAPS